MVSRAVMGGAATFAVRNATKIDARGVEGHFWLISVDGGIVATGTRDDDFESAWNVARTSQSGPVGARIFDAEGAVLTP
ncbi:MAG: N-acetylglucosamine-6-phosphate deacetylase, partial [Bifidobacterium sp.]